MTETTIIEEDLKNLFKEMRRIPEGNYEHFRQVVSQSEWEYYQTRFGYSDEFMKAHYIKQVDLIPVERDDSNDDNN